MGECQKEEGMKIVLRGPGFCLGCSPGSLTAWLCALDKVFFCAPSYKIEI